MRRWVCGFLFYLFPMRFLEVSDPRIKEPWWCLISQQFPSKIRCSESMVSIRVIALMSLIETWDGFENNEESAAISFWNGSLS